MEGPVAIFVDGVGAAAATSGVLTQLQGRIFALLYLEPGPVSLEEIANQLGQSKSNLSVNIRGLTEWHLVRRISVAGSRKDHYEAATNFWRVMQEIMERRVRWAARHVAAVANDTQRALEKPRGPRGSRASKGFAIGRLEALRAFFSAVDTGIEAFTQGKPFAPATLLSPLRVVPPQQGSGSR